MKRTEKETREVTQKVRNIYSWIVILFYLSNRFQSMRRENWTREQLIWIAEEADIDTSGTLRQLYTRVLQNLQEEFRENNGDYSNRRQLESEPEDFDENELLWNENGEDWNENENDDDENQNSINHLIFEQNESTHSETVSEEDTNDFSSITSSEADINEIKEFTSSQCKNDDLIMGEPYTVDTNDDVFIMYIQKPNSNKFNDTGICVSKTEIKQYLKSDLTEDGGSELS